MINAAVRNSIRGSGRQAYPHQVARALPRAGLLLYLGRPNLEAADVPIGDDMFLLPADADIRAATGWVSGTGNIFYDAVGDPVAVLASEIASWSSINQWNVLFHLVSADTETGRLAIYSMNTPLATLNKALRVLREDQIDLTPTAYFNGVFTPAQIAAAGGTYTGGPTVFANNLGALQTAPSGMPALQGMRFTGGVYYDTTSAGTPLLPSVNQPTRTFDAGFTTSTPAANYKKYTRTNPAVDLPGYLCEPARTNKVACRKANPVDTTGLAKSGDAAAVLSVVDDTAALTAAGLMGYPDSPCTTGKVYKLDNSLGTAKAYVVNTSGTTGNINAHCVSAYGRASLGGGVSLNDVVSPALFDSTYSRKTKLYLTPGATWVTAVTADPGSIVYFILPQLEEGPFCTSTIAKLQDGTDPLAAITRAGTVLSFPTAGKIRSNNMAFRMIVVPRANTTFTNRLFSMFPDVSNKIRINGFSNDGNCEVLKTIAGVDSTLKFNSSSLVNGVGLDLLFIQSSTSGMVGSARKYTSGVWSAWSPPVTNATAGGKANMPVAPTYQLGSMLGIDQFTGNISLFDTLFIPTGITDPLAWAKAQWRLPA